MAQNADNFFQLH